MMQLILYIYEDLSITLHQIDSWIFKFIIVSVIKTK